MRDWPSRIAKSYSGWIGPAHFVPQVEQVAERSALIEGRPNCGKWDRLRLVCKRDEDDAVRRQQRRGRAEYGDAETLSHHRKQGAALNIEALDGGCGPAPDEA